MSENQKVRQSGLDVVRFIACLFVVCEHFYLNCGYYDEPLTGKIMFTETFFRWMFMICVPLYMMLTGYFKSSKTVCRKHYMSLIPIGISYIVISTFKMLLYNRLYGTIYTLPELLKNLGDYNIAWYMGMYIGIIILCPFLNKLWKALDGRKEQHILILSFGIICALYPVFHYVIPSYFYNLYPIMYYFIGIYIKEHEPKINKWLLAGIYVASVLVETVISFTAVRGGVFNWNIMSTADSGLGGLFVAIGAICVFLICYDIKIKNKAICFILEKISGVSFEIYLFAGAYDAIIYKYAKNSLTSAVDFFWYFFVTALLSFVLAVISSLVYKAIYNFVKGVFTNVFKKNR